MAETWVLCVNLRGARLFEYLSREDRVNFLRELPRPRVQVRDEHLPDADEQLERPRKPAVLKLEYAVAQDYSRSLSRFLTVAARHERYSRLVIAAEDRLLKILGQHLSGEVRVRLLGTVEQDLYDINTTDLLPYLTDLARGSRAA